MEVSLLGNFQLEVLEAGRSHFHNTNDCDFEAPLGRTRRVISLPEGERLETDDTEQYDVLFNELHPGIGLKWKHWLEERWKWVIICLLGLLSATGAAVVWGIPYAARVVSYKLPTDWNNTIGDGVLEAMDRYFMDPSALTAEKQALYLEWFDEMTMDFESEQSFTILFRSSGIGANAFALPNGIVVVTDDILDLTSAQEEFEAIIAHEIGHVIKRHAMQMVIRDAGVFMFISILLGDLASVSSLSAAIPTLLIENNYSREFEREADLVSGVWLQEKYG